MGFLLLGYDQGVMSGIMYVLSALPMTRRKY
jgi:hypothetical protein